MAKRHPKRVRRSKRRTPARSKTAVTVSARFTVAVSEVLLLPAISLTSLQELRQRRKQRWQLGGAAAAILMLGIIGVGFGDSLTGHRVQTHAATEAETALDPALSQRLHRASNAVAQLEARQTASGINLINTADLEQQLAQVQVQLQHNQLTDARSQLEHIEATLPAATSRIADAAAAQHLDPAATTSADTPILMYHQPPNDFVAQMEVLQQRGYTTVTLEQLAAHLAGTGALPPKPVVITFDDGFADQQGAADYLSQHNMKATFYIIDGGEASKWCIGANRHTDLPCGDAYLSWDQIKALDRNPLFTIASHTLDHLDLAKQSHEAQVVQIIEGKKQLEDHLGHKVYDFAYPYGSFNADTVDIARQAGFITATTTTPGTLQTASSLLTLKRIRDTYNLP